MSDKLFDQLADIVHGPIKEQPALRSAYQLGACEQVLRNVAGRITEFENDGLLDGNGVATRDVTALLRDLRNAVESYWRVKLMSDEIKHEHVPLEELERRHKSTTSLRAGWLDNDQSVDVKGV